MFFKNWFLVEKVFWKGKIVLRIRVRMVQKKNSYFASPLLSREWNKEKKREVWVDFSILCIQILDVSVVCFFKLIVESNLLSNSRSLVFFHLLYDEDPTTENLTFVGTHRFKLTFSGTESYHPNIRKDYKYFTKTIPLFISKKFILSFTILTYSFICNLERKSSIPWSF